MFSATVEGRHQARALEDDPDLEGPLGAGRSSAGQLTEPTRRLLQSGEQVQQCRLARTRRADHRHPGAPRRPAAAAVDGDDRAGAAPEHPGDLSQRTRGAAVVHGTPARRSG